MESDLNNKEIPSLHHLMRVRIRTTTFEELKKIAKDETDRSGEYTSVSDLVRVALNNWIRTHQSAQRLRMIVNSPNKRDR